MKRFKHLKYELEKPKEWKTISRKKDKSALEYTGIIFYSLACLASLILAILYSKQMLLFYFFICTSIFSSIMLLWWGGSKKDIQIKKGSGAFIKFVYWLGFLVVLFYLYLFISSTYEILIIPSLIALSAVVKSVVLFSGLGLMFISLLTANLLYRKEVAENIRQRTNELKKEIEKKLKDAEKNKTIAKKEEKMTEKTEKTEKIKEVEKIAEKKTEPAKRRGDEKTIETKLDDLFNMLEQNKTVKLSSIIKKFEIKKEEALDWCSVLTEHGLAELVYPAFGEPELRLKS